MNNEKSMGILEFREYLLRNIDKYSLTELEGRLGKAKDNFRIIEERYNNNNSDFNETSLFNAGCRVATYKKALKEKPKYEPIELRLSNDDMQYTMF